MSLVKTAGAALLAATALSAAEAATARPAGLSCAAVSIAAAGACVETPGGVVYAPERAEAERVRPYAQAGEERFRRHFGVEPAPYALVLGTVSPEDEQALRRAGAKVVQRWMTQAQQRSQQEAALRNAVQNHAKQRGVPDDQIPAEVERVVREQGARMHGPDRDSGVVPHELGHQWLVQAFWPDAGLDRPSHYGGPGPDWLDETAAVAMEDPALTEERRAAFRQAYAAGDPRLENLAEYLGMEHPMRKVLAQGGPGVGSAGGSGGAVRSVVQMRSGTGAVPPMSDAGRMYIQGRVFADFLMEKTGDPAVLAKLARAFADGQTMDAWLARSGRAAGLGTNVAELQANWSAWIKSKYGGAQS